MDFAGSLRKVLLSITCAVVVALVLAFTLCMYQREKKKLFFQSRTVGGLRGRERM